MLNLTSKTLLPKIVAFMLLVVLTLYSFTAEAEICDAVEVNFIGHRLDWGNVDPHGSPYTLPNAMSVTVTLSDKRQGWNLYVTAADDFRSSTGQTFPIERLELLHTYLKSRVNSKMQDITCPSNRRRKGYAPH